MYLLVFVTLAISLMGIYAEILSVQASQLAAGQATVAETMLTWHATAVAQAEYTQISAPIAAGCDLTASGAANNPCQNAALPANVYVDITPPPNWTPQGVICSGQASAGPCWTNLPTGYNTAIYKFYSIYYSPGAGQKYVITFVPPPLIAVPGFIFLPGGNQIGITMSDLMNQLRNASTPALAYGVVNGGVLTTVPISSGGAPASFQYTMPTAGCPPCAVPNGSVAIISSP